MPDSTNAQKKNPQGYEIVEPLSYAAFPLTPAQKEAPEPRAATLSVARLHQERWDDTGKPAPKVPEQFKADFIPPEHAAIKATAAPSAPGEKRAIWIVHGMGQQIPFETVDGLARGILDELALQNPPQYPTPRLRTVEIAGQVLQRVEIDVAGQSDDSGHAKNYELHLYETYWAPKTEGVAKLADVVSFLWDGGLRGLLNSYKPFQRAMFGGMASFKIPWRSPLYLCITLLLLIALTAINAVILSAAAAKTKLEPLASLGTHWHQLASVASCMIAAAFTFGIVLFLAEMCKPKDLSSTSKRFLTYLGWASLFFTVAQILITALVMSVITHLDWLLTHNNSNSSQTHDSFGAISPLLHRVFLCFISGFQRLPFIKLQAFSTAIILCGALLLALAMIFRAILRSSEQPVRGDSVLKFFAFLAFLLNLLAIVVPLVLFVAPHFEASLPPYLSFIGSSLWVFPFLILFSAKVREIMVQYVGDVAIYVRSNKLDRFDQVRNAIKESARSVVSAIFTAYDLSQKKFLYDSIALVGHSLGSVIAYDTLNRLMLDDWLSQNTLQVSERTKSLITFGSPLNKTAFFFTIQAKDALHIRERLAATVQPLIMSYPKFRELRWINVYSPNDIVSGKLEFYDLPGLQNPPAVTNVPDPDAFVPLVAHTSYWGNPTVWRNLLAQIAP